MARISAGPWLGLGLAIALQLGSGSDHTALAQIPEPPGPAPRPTDWSEIDEYRAPRPGTGPDMTHTTTHSQWSEAMLRRLDQSVIKMRAHNAWMKDRKVSGEYQTLGKQLLENAGWTRVLIRGVGELPKTDSRLRDPARARDLMRLEERLGSWVRELDRVHDALENLTGH
jgi:hypothetical protein